MANLNIRPEAVPPTFLLCFNAKCSRKETCLRYASGELAASIRDYGRCVFPTALGQDGECRYFYRIRRVRLAWGFRTLFRMVHHKDYAILRMQVMALFGSDSQFFRYNRGDYKLTPERQEEVFEVFRRWGYDASNLSFEHYEDTIDFISEP